jgi:hypothetical protein
MSFAQLKRAEWGSYYRNFQICGDLPTSRIANCFTTKNTKNGNSKSFN